MDMTGGPLPAWLSTTVLISNFNNFSIISVMFNSMNVNISFNLIRLVVIGFMLIRYVYLSGEKFI